jgi:hypothetical protein
MPFPKYSLGIFISLATTHRPALAHNPIYSHRTAEQRETAETK